MPFSALFRLLFFLCVRLLFANSRTVYNPQFQLSPTEQSPQCRCASEETFGPGISSGVFKSPGFPARYCNNLNCRWNIAPSEDSFVGAMLDYFETEQRFDVLEVYQTRWNGSVLMRSKHAMLHGSFDPKSMERQFFSSVGGGLIFRFITDNTDSDFHGFQISFRRYPKSDRLNTPCPLPFHTASSEVQNLPVLDSNFHLDSSCIFVINSTEAVKLTINQFRSSILSLKVYETENFQVRTQLGRPLAKIQPGILPPLPLLITSRTPSLTVLFSTQQTPFSDHNFLNHGRVALSGAGRNDRPIYEIQFQATQSLCACPPSELVVSRLRPSTITSPGFPLEYCDSANCTMKVSLEGPRANAGPMAEGLRVSIESFATELDLDYLAVWDAEGNTMLTLSGDARNIRFLTFDRPQFAFSFITDHSLVLNGFNISVEAYKKQKECLCPASPRAVLEGRSHHEENRFNRIKCPFMDCFWLIKPPRSANPDAYHRIVLKINHTMLHSSDFIMISQGDQRDRNPFTRNLNALSSGIEVSIEYDGALPLSIWFHREAEETASIEAIYGEHMELNFSYEWREVCLCGAEMYQADIEHWQPLRSPDYPNTYCRSMRCKWRLNAPEGYHLLLNVSSFVTEADQDFLYIFDWNDTTVGHKEMLTGTLYGTNIVRGKQSVMTLLFTSDGSIQATGFEIWFRAELNPGAEPLVGQGHSGHKTIVFFLLIVLAATGSIFLFARYDQSQRFASNINWPVVFTRRLPNFRHRRQPSTELSSSSSTILNSSTGPASFMGANPNFRFP